MSLPQTPTPAVEQFFTSVNTPPTLNLSTDISTNWKLWKEQWDDYALVVQISEKPSAVQRAIFLNTIGTGAFRIYRTLNQPAGMEQDELETVIAMFDAYTKSYTIVVYIRTLPVQLAIART